MEWKKVEGFNYWVSNTGLVKNNSGKILKPYDNGHGYKKVSLCKNGKVYRLYVHRLVGFAFVNGFENGLTIDHLDKNRSNNNWYNLEWVTLEENVKRSHVKNI